MQFRILGGAASSVVPADRKLDGLHGMRAVAACMIVIFHVIYLTELPLPPWLTLVKPYFGAGVHVFFVLSAFSLAYSGVRTQTSTREYLIKRFFRIAPLFYGMIVYSQLTDGVRSLGHNVMNVLFAFNFAPGMHPSMVMAGWTIGVEMIFYALLPVILSACRSFAAFAVFALCALAVSYFGRVQLETAAPQGYAHMAFISNLWFFAIGLLAYSAAQEKWTMQAAIRPVAIGLAGIVIIGCLLAWPTALLFAGRPDSLMFGLAFGCITLWQAMRPSWLMRISPMQFIGERSYSVYLLHPAIIVILIRTGAYSWMRETFGDSAIFPALAITFALVFALSQVTYRLVEVPGINVGRWIIGRREAVRPGDSIVP